MATTKLTRQEIKDRLCGIDQIAFGRDGVITVRRGFFYRHGQEASDLVRKVRDALPEATVVDSGEVWKPFVGGARLERQSHWFVKFTV